jgi:hypothetical protein
MPLFPAIINANRAPTPCVENYFRQLNHHADGGHVAHWQTCCGH